MNAKRWIALGIVIALLCISGVFKIFSTMISNNQKESEGGNNVISTLLSAEDISENTVEEGDYNKIAVLNVEGTIQDTGETTSLLNNTGYDHSFFMQQLEVVKKDKNVKGVLLYVNSPGGGVMESAQIRDKLLEIKKERRIPVYVSMGSMAASGGYYISAPADKIFASKETITGSIGVIMTGYDYSELMKKVGIKNNVLKSGPHKDILSNTRGMTEEEKGIIQSMITDSYNEFVKVVVSGRHLPEEKVKKIADGRIYDGRQAKANGLIDAFGYKKDALTALKKSKNALNNATVVEYEQPTGIGSLFQSSLSSLMDKNADLMMLIKQTGTLKAPRMMYLYGSE